MVLPTLLSHAFLDRVANLLLPISSGRAGNRYQNLVVVHDDILTRIVSVCLLGGSLLHCT